jgi:hypothetical protein
VNVLGETTKFSVTTHLIYRWRERIGNGSYDEISSAVKEIVKNGTKYPVDDCHYRICYEGVCVIFMQLSPLHALAKTVYLREENTLSAV